VIPVYLDHRPVAAEQMLATDYGIVCRHGDGPGGCDLHGAREAVIYRENGLFHLFYDGAGEDGWRACLATSRDLIHWQKRGAILQLGEAGSPDSAGAISPWAINDGKLWHMFYLGTPNATPAPDHVPSFPYLTLEASAPRLAGPWTKHYSVTPWSPQPDSWYSNTASPGFIIRYHGEFVQYMSGASQPPGQLVKRTLGIARTKNLDGPWTLAKSPLVPIEEQIENSSVYYEPANGYWFLFTDGIHEFTDAIWVYWSKDPLSWDAKNKAVVLDGSNCTWSHHCIGMPAVVPLGKRLAVLYDGPGGDSTSHLNRDLGLAWLDLPLTPPHGASSSP